MKKMLFNGMIVISFVLITFFSACLDTNAASFAYKDFDWEEFSKINKNYWTSRCAEDDDECEDVILATKKRFYIHLYDLLAEFQSKYGFIDDNLITATTFFGLDETKFRDPLGEKDPYNLDDSDDSGTKNKFLGIFSFADSEKDEVKDYYEKEIDTLKTLINSFIGYRSTCYGETSTITQTDENGNTYQTCPSGLDINGDKCIIKLDTYVSNFYDYIGNLLESFGVSFGISFVADENRTKCKEKAEEKGYSNFDYEASSTREVSEDFFFHFLENEDYFDKKDHLQEYFIPVLSLVKKDHMNELTQEERKKYDEEIKEVRRKLIARIKEIASRYKDVTTQYNKVSNSNAYWWPIGSDETTEFNGIIMASGVPTQTTITSNFGNRTHPVTGQVNKKHNGIDIGGILGTTNVIASKDGVVSSVVTGCQDGSNQSCGSGYGNHIIIQHLDGNYTMYAHLYNGSITVSIGDSVKQGQVIGKVGNSGVSTGPHLHFEVRVGGNDLSSVQDPLNFVSNTDTRPSGGTGEIIIPEEYGNAGFFTYTKITDFNWIYNQKKVYELWKKSGAKSNNYIATIDDRYLIACTSTYGNIGDKIDFYLADGTKIETIMFDEKSQKSVAWDRNPANKWGHNGGQQIIEFEIIHNPNGSGDVGTWTGWSGQRVTSATNLGENVIGQTPGGITSSDNLSNSSNKS